MLLVVLAALAASVCCRTAPPVVAIAARGVTVGVRSLLLALATRAADIGVVPRIMVAVAGVELCAPLLSSSAAATPRAGARRLERSCDAARIADALGV